MRQKEHKTVCANTRGIIISFRDVNKHKFVPYNYAVEQKQLYQTAKYQQVFNTVQQRIYTQTVYGLNAYTYQQIKNMSPEEKSLIIKRYTRVQAIINRLKDQILATKLFSILEKTFHRSEIMREICKSEAKPIALQVLNEEQIAKILVEKRLLPSNFFQIA